MTMRGLKRSVLLISVFSSLLLIGFVTSRTEGSLELIAVLQAGKLEDRFHSECQKTENNESCQEFSFTSKFPAGMTVDDISDAFKLMPEQRAKMFTILTNRFIQGSNIEGYVLLDPRLASDLRSMMSLEKKTYVIMHGWLQSVEEIKKYAEAILAAEDSQVIGVDWAQLATGEDFFLSAFNVHRVAEYVGRLVTWMVQNKMLNIDHLHVVGHSMGCIGASQIASVVLRESGHKVARASGLDCARPFFEMFPKSRKMNPAVAHLVEVVHTNAGDVLHDGSAGDVAILGHVDFFVSGGRVQPRCLLLNCDVRKSDCLAAVNGCSHVAALDYFLESFTPGATFEGRKCESQEIFDSCKCQSQVYASIGADLKEEDVQYGVYYLNANPSRPFAQGHVQCDGVPATSPSFANIFIFIIVTLFL